jgi:hypothetical protein
MPRRLVLPVLIALLALAALPAAASAGWFPAAANPLIDGPSPDVDKLGGVDLARDGTGGLVYLKRVDGTSHVFLSRFNGGAFRPPERVDNGILAGASDAVIAAADADRLAIVWTAGNFVYGSMVTGNDEQPGPLLGPTPLYAAPGPVSAPSVDMGINGTAYASYTAPGGGGADVHVSRLMDTTWSAVEPPLDIEPGLAAGTGNQRSRAGVSAEGNGIVAWGEGNKVYARRVTGLIPSSYPQELSIPSIGPSPGGRADSPDIDIEDDGSFVWAVFRQDIGGGSRAIARRMLGSTFDPPVLLDGGPGSTNPRIAMNGRGQGLATFESPGGGASGNVLYNDIFGPGQPFHSAASVEGSGPLPAASEHRENVVAWRVVSPGGGVSLRGRMQPEPTKPFDPEVELSRPDLGAVPAGQYAVTADRLAGFVVAMAQGPPTSRAITVALQDRLPGRPGAIAHSAWQSSRRPKLEWRAGRDLWGPQRFRVVVGGKVVGETTGTSIVPSQRLSAGRPISYQVIAIDARGQENASRTRKVRFDNVAPKFKVRILGKRRAGRALRIVVNPRDGKGSGVSEVRVRYGDSKHVVKQRKRFGGRHAYRKGTFTLRVTVYDIAGNRRTQKVKLHIT